MMIIIIQMLMVVVVVMDMVVVVVMDMVVVVVTELFKRQQQPQRKYPTELSNRTIIIFSSLTAST